MILYFDVKGHYMPHCAPFPPLTAPPISPFKNFNKATFTTHYIKKTAANFTLNGSLLILNSYFCFNKILFINLSRLLQFCQTLKKITRPKIILDYYRSPSLKAIKTTGLRLKFTLSSYLLFI